MVTSKCAGSYIYELLYRMFKLITKNRRSKIARSKQKYRVIPQKSKCLSENYLGFTPKFAQPKGDKMALMQPQNPVFGTAKLYF